MKILFVGDVHYGEKNPVARTDNYGEAILSKLRLISDISRQLGAEKVFFLGDMTHKAVNSYKELVSLSEALDSFNCGLLVVPGNHDLRGHSFEEFYFSTLGLLYRLGNIDIIMRSSGPVEIGDCVVTAQEYTPQLDSDESGYSYELPEEYKDRFHIHLVHGMLLPSKPVFDKYTLVSDLNTTADLLVTGHYHEGFQAVKEQDGKVTKIVNPGSICRRTASDIDRDVFVLVFDTDTKDSELLKLDVPSGTEVLTREHLENDNKEKTEEFLEVLASEITAKQFVNVMDFVKHVGLSLGVEQEVVDYVEKKLVNANSTGDTIGRKL